MSLCMCIFDNRHLYISADTRASIKDSFGNHYCINDNAAKIHKINNKIVFNSGTLEICEKVIIRFKSLRFEQQTITNLAMIAQQIVEDDKKNNPHDYNQNYRALELVVAVIEQGTPIVYSISSHEGFNIRRLQGTHQTIFFTVGTYGDEAAEVVYANWNVSAFDMFLKGYEALADEAVGGKMQYYQLCGSDIQYDEAKIKDNKELKSFRSHCSATEGLKIQTNKGTSTNPSWTDQLYADANGDLNITGKITATSGTFNGIINATGGEFSGNITAKGTITGGTIKGAKFDIGDITGSTITAGTINGTNINGGLITGSTINGGTINVRTDVTIGNNLILNGLDDLAPKKIVFTNAGDISADYVTGTIRIDSNRVVMPSATYVGNGYDEGNKVVTQSKLTSIYNDLDSIKKQIIDININLKNKSNIGHTHFVTTADHNHGNPQNAHSGGGTYATTGATN